MSQSKVQSQALHLVSFATIVDDRYTYLLQTTEDGDIMDHGSPEAARRYFEATVARSLLIDDEADVQAMVRELAGWHHTTYTARAHAVTPARLALVVSPFDRDVYALSMPGAGTRLDVFCRRMRPVPESDVFRAEGTPVETGVEEAWSAVTTREYVEGQRHGGLRLVRVD